MQVRIVPHNSHSAVSVVDVKVEAEAEVEVKAIVAVEVVVVVVVVVGGGGACPVFDGGVFCASAYKITGRRIIRSSAGSTVARAAKHNFCRHLWPQRT